METLTLRRPSDFHVHFRRGQILVDVAPETSKVFGRATIEPNCVPEILTGPDWIAYRQEIQNVCGTNFEPLGTIKITDTTTPDMIDEAADCGIMVTKWYPKGVTTGADMTGITSFRRLYPVLKRIEERNMIASLHGERPGANMLQAEIAFLPTLERLAYDFPNLRIIMEHLSTAKAVEMVKSLPVNVAATITAHHLWLTMNDVFGALTLEQIENIDAVSVLYPHNFCKPVANSSTDRFALISAAASGNPKFFFGSDSAPHLLGMKTIQPRPKAGVFSAPIALPILAQVFSLVHLLERLEDFVSKFGAEFYGLPLNPGAIKLVREPWQVPLEQNGIGLWLGGRTINWRVA